MRLWHYKIIQYLPKSQLIAQWRELNSIYKKQDNHILINYIYNYDKQYLLSYSLLVIEELERQNVNIKKWDNFEEYFGMTYSCAKSCSKFLVFSEHNNQYLLQNFYNLQEKYDRGQKDFSCKLYERLFNMTFPS